MVILSFSGKKQVGKSTAANLLVKSHGFTEISFAAPLKKACAYAFNIQLENFESQQLKEVPLNKPVIVTEEQIVTFLDFINETYLPLPFKKKQAALELAGKELRTPREIMQFMGTELARNKISDDIWVEILKKRVRKLEKKKYVISDARLPNERAAIQELRGKTILIIRKTEGFDDSHSTENSLGEPSEYDVVIENFGSLARFLEQVNMWYSLKRIR